MEVLKKIEKMLNVKIESIEKLQRKSFPLFDVVDMYGVRLALIKNPSFVIVTRDDIYEKRIDGDFIVIETDEGYILARYSGVPNVEALRVATVAEEEEESKQVTEEAEREEAETQGEEDEEVSNNENEEQEEGEYRGSNPVEEILEKLPRWADGAVVVKKDSDIVVLPIKKSTKKEDAYYASLSWRPLDVREAEELINRVVTKDGQVIEANIYVGDKYVNIFIRNSPSRSKKRRHK